MMKRIWWLGLGIIAGLILVAVAALAFARPYTFHGSLIDPPVAAPDFRLTDQDGQTLQLSEQPGQVWLIFFGYTHCPDACPATMTQFKRVRAALGAQADQVRFALITVDPDRDTPERLREYLAAFDPAFVGLTGSMSDLETVWKSYGVFREVVSLSGTPMPDASMSGTPAAHSHGGDDYLIDHTTRIYVIDRQGNLRLTYTLDVSTAELMRDVQELLP